MWSSRGSPSNTSIRFMSESADISRPRQCRCRIKFNYQTASLAIVQHIDAALVFTNRDLQPSRPDRQGSATMECAMEALADNRTR